MRFNEEKNILGALEYIKGTYGEHYVGKNEVQTIDVWDSMGIAADVCQATAIKYLMRFGKKDGYNKKDIIKAIHYIILLEYFIERDQKFNNQQTE